MSERQQVTVSDHVIAKADDAFWAAVAAAYPEVTSGDLAPEASSRFAGQERDIVNLWLTTNHPANRPALWVVEHGAEYNVPREIAEALPDLSWHNDACPSFGWYDDDDDKSKFPRGGVRLWVDLPTAEERYRAGDVQEHRYAVVLYSDDSSSIGTLYDGDSTAEALDVTLRTARILGFFVDGPNA